MRQNQNTPAFELADDRASDQERNILTPAEIITSIALGLCTLIAMIAVLSGIAHAHTLGTVTEHEKGVFAIVLMVGLFFAVIAWISVTPPYPRKNDRG